MFTPILCQCLLLIFHGVRDRVNSVSSSCLNLAKSFDLSSYLFIERQGIISYSITIKILSFKILKFLVGFTLVGLFKGDLNLTKKNILNWTQNEFCVIC